MENLLSVLNSIGPLPDELFYYLLSVVKERQVKKGQILQQPGQPAATMFFIERGLLRCYSIIDGKEACSWFQSEGYPVTSVASWYRRIPTYEYIDALEDSLVYAFSQDALAGLYRQFPEFNLHGRVLTEQCYTLVWEWLNVIRYQKAHERYAFIVDHFTNWVQRVPSKHIASFLGLTEAHFSHVKSKLRNL